MSSLFRRELLHTIRRESTGASHRCSYSVASKKRKGQPRPASPVSALAPNAPRPSAAEPVYTSPSPSPQPNPPPPSPPPSWRWPFSSGSSSSSTRNPAVDVAALDDAKHYDLTKQASWADPPLVAQARTKTVRQRNVFESFLGECASTICCNPLAEVFPLLLQSYRPRLGSSCHSHYSPSASSDSTQATG